MELKNLFEKKIKMVEEEYQEKEKIEKFILNELKYLNEDFFGEDKISKNWEIEVLENEFLIFYSFGHINFKDILKLSEIYKKHGFELYYITDAFTQRKGEKGLMFGFHKMDDEEKK